MMYNQEAALADLFNDQQGWYFVCHACGGLSSREIERAQNNYGSMRSAQRGFAAHAQTHMERPSIVEKARALVEDETI